MGFRSLADKLAGVAFKATGDIPKSVTYNSITIGAYDPATGTTSTTTASHTVQAILSGYHAYEVDGEAVKPFDQKALIRQSELPVTPKLTDTVIIDAVVWNVLDKKQDEAGATWTIQLRMA